VTDDATLLLPTVKPGDEYVQESDEDVEDNGGDDDDDENDDDDGDESDEEGEESAEVLEKQSKYLYKMAIKIFVFDDAHGTMCLRARILNSVRLERWKNKKLKLKNSVIAEKNLTTLSWILAHHYITVSFPVR